MDAWSTRRPTFLEHADNPRPVRVTSRWLRRCRVVGTTVRATLSTCPPAGSRAWVAAMKFVPWPVLADERVVVAGGPDEVAASVGDRSARLVPERRAETPSKASGNGWSRLSSNSTIAGSTRPLAPARIRALRRAAAGPPGGGRHSQSGVRYPTRRWRMGAHQPRPAPESPLQTRW